MADRTRLAVLGRHLVSASDPAPLRPFEAAALSAFLCRDNQELIQRMYAHLEDPLYRPDFYQDLMAFRELTYQRMKLFASQGFFSVRDYLDDPLRFMACLAVTAVVDYSLCIKLGVHFTLAGGAIAKLGTRKHHASLFPRLDSLDLPACFGMTELGNGSDVMGIETQATYDAGAGEFVIHTPRNTASKFWIGGAAQHGRLCTVFAQLTVGGKHEGVHCFAVRLRDDEGQVLPGVRVRDNGPKAGLNGVDNGQIWFDHVRVPRDALLDAFGSVSEDGMYSSPIASVSQRFGTMVGGLTCGRMLIAQGAVDACKVALCVALRYCAARVQFGVPILAYLTHQRLLLPALASTYAFHLGLLRLKAVYAQKRPADAKHIHIASSALKAGATWAKVDILQTCREACGGQGFLAANLIGPLKNDLDVDTTFEGANAVLLQQVAKALLEEQRRKGTGAPKLPPGASFADPAGILALLRYREEALTCEVAADMAAAAGAGASPAAAFQAALDLAVALGWAHVDRLTYQGFMEEVAGLGGPAGEAAAALCRLHGLARLERGAAFFLAAGALTGAQTRELRKEVNALCGRLASDGGRPALTLAAGFGIPEYIIAQAPCAVDWRKIGAELPLD